MQDRKEYLSRLIAGGVDPVSAADVASKTVVARKLSGGGPLRPLNAAAAVQIPVPAQGPASESSTTRTVGPSSGSVEKGRTKGRPPVKSQLVEPGSGPIQVAPKKRVATAPKAKPLSAVKLVKDEIQLEQAPALKISDSKTKKQQLSLFELAPWADNLRAMPNDLARSALFTVRNKRVPRVGRQSHSIFVLSKGVEITYTGIELRASDDELVWLQILEYAKHATVGTPITFTFSQLCRDLGWSINGGYYTKAEECLTRLQATALQFISGRVGRLDSVSLIHRFRVLERGTKNSRCEVSMDDDVVKLFAGKYYSKFEWEKYRSLSPTARRMFDYFVSHSDPFPMLLESFRLLCGSDSERPKKWTEQTNKACDELTKSGLVKRTWVTGDKISCERN